MRWIGLSGALAIAMAISPVAARQAATPPPPPSTAASASLSSVRVEMTTSAGAICLDLDRQHAPATTANFLRYVDAKRLDGTGFYRAAHLGEGIGLLQGGIRDDPKRRLPPVRHEPTSMTGLAHVDGAISMARGRPGSAAGDFFVILGTVPYLDADPTKPGDNGGYAVFGRVVEGMDLVRRIWDAPRSATGGTAATRGQMLAAPLRILNVRRKPCGPSPQP